ncbi:contractile ring myosin V regulator Rng9 [Schizosaccharomyces osmophilus]|uniref:Contractile ring myosin V regulator Rng9 n=1 Tax=Schizosaccharomyces osmophilus TaxID=2545709 RepID=A0AAE9W6E7_9SCHI|nr:contractile ring myosin V regulator Rng9 [Schizosaccharomyces osmophilus]WBW70897.1 contractile ring myosin V regulator Rng9 [Schizosaccharomyces osmophilus]
MTHEKSNTNLPPGVNRQTGLVLLQLKEEEDNQRKELSKYQKLLKNENGAVAELEATIDEVREKTDHLRHQNQQNDEFLRDFHDESGSSVHRKSELRDKIKVLEDSVLNYHASLKRDQAQLKVILQERDLAKSIAQKLQTSLNLLHSQSNPQLIQDLLIETKNCKSSVVDQTEHSGNLLRHYSDISDRMEKMYTLLVDTSRAHRVALTDATKSYTYLFDSNLTNTRHQAEDISNSIEKYQSKKLPTLQSQFIDYKSLKDFAG